MSKRKDLNDIYNAAFTFREKDPVRASFRAVEKAVQKRERRRMRKAIIATIEKRIGTEVHKESAAYLAIMECTR